MNAINPQIFRPLKNWWLCSVLDSNGALVFETTGLTEEAAVSKAALIVRACNSHAALVAIEQKAGRVLALFDADYLRGHGDAGRATHAIKELRAAIAAAKGLQS